MKSLPLSIAQWMPLPYRCLGKEGFGLSEDRQVLCDHFEVSAHHIVLSSLQTLLSEGVIERDEYRALLTRLPRSGNSAPASIEKEDP